MKLNIIHLSHRNDRRSLLEQELQCQGINNYQIWPGILDPFPKKGISKAHKQVVEFAKNSCLESILICEDDIKFTAPAALEFFLMNEPLDYDLYLGSIFYGTLEDDNSVSDFAGLTLYIIKQKFYETFLSSSENVDIDRALAGKGKFIVCHPFVAVQHNGYSDNYQDYRNHDVFLKNRKLFI